MSKWTNQKEENIKKKTKSSKKRKALLNKA